MLDAAVVRLEYIPSWSLLWGGRAPVASNCSNWARSSNPFVPGGRMFLKPPGSFVP